MLRLKKKKLVVYVRRSAHYSEVFKSLGLQTWRDRVRFLIFAKNHGMDHTKMCPFNAGYYAATIGLFYDMPVRCKQMIQQGLLDICKFNTQPLMMCLLQDKTRGERWIWNHVNYGWKSGLEVDRATMGSIHWNGPGKGWDEHNEYRWAFEEYHVDAETIARAVAAARGRDKRRLEYMENVKNVLALTRKLSVDLRDVVAAATESQKAHAGHADDWGSAELLGVGAMTGTANASDGLAAVREEDVFEAANVTSPHAHLLEEQEAAAFNVVM